MSRLKKVGVHLRHSLRGEFLFIVGAVLTVVMFLSFTHVKQPFTSAEVKFTDASKGGLAIMPASCPSVPENPDYPHDTCDTPPPDPPQPPTNPQADCSEDSTSVTLTWNPGAGATGYDVRVNYIPNDIASCLDGWYCADPADKIVDNYSSTNCTGSTCTYTQSITPDIDYNWWVHSRNADGVTDAVGTSFSCPAPTSGCTLTADPSNLTEAGTVRLSADITGWAVTDWTGTLTDVPGTVGIDEDGPWDVLVSEDKTFTLEGTYTSAWWFEEELLCSTSVTVDDDDDDDDDRTCENGYPAPDGDIANCSCEQQHPDDPDACDEDDETSCVEPLHTKCVDSSHWATYDDDENLTDGDGDLCGPEGDCPYAAYPRYECTDTTDGHWCPTPTRPDVEFTVSPTLVHLDDRTNITWKIKAVGADDEPIECTISGTNGNTWTDTRDRSTTPVTHTSSGILAQTIFGLECYGKITGIALPAFTPITVNLIPTFTEE